MPKCKNTKKSFQGLQAVSKPFLSFFKRGHNFTWLKPGFKTWAGINIEIARDHIVLFMKLGVYQKLEQCS